MKRVCCKFVFILVVWVNLIPLAAAADCVLKMVYKDGGKKPLIAKQPDNSGAYFDLFSAAAEKIGCDLEIHRLSKKRLHEKLAEGEFDFYPGASFSLKRSEYLAYIPNGFMTGEYGISTLDINEISGYADIKKQDLTWLMELGGSKHEVAANMSIPVQGLRSVDLSKAIELFRRGRSHFYVADKELIDYYPTAFGIESFDSVGMKIHRSCCGGDVPMYMGFSKSSPNYEDVPNPTFDSSQAISPSNTPRLVKPGSIVHQLAEALEELRSTGISLEIYNRNFDSS